MAEIDKKIGRQIKKLRQDWGLSLISLAERVNLSFQQIQKYEKGETTISVFRLQQIAKALGVTLSFFFEKESSHPKASDSKTEYHAESNDSPQVAPLSKEEITFLKILRQFQDKKMKQLAIRLIKEMLKADKKENTSLS